MANQYKSALLTESQNEIVNEIISALENNHLTTGVAGWTSDDDYIETFTSGGGYIHTLILLNNKHIVAIHFEDGIVEYSFDKFDTIEDYLSEENSDKEKGFGWEFMQPNHESRMAELSEGGFTSFFKDAANDKFKDGGNVYVDKKYNITYSVEQRPDGRWTVYAESPNFERNDVYAPSGLASKEDAIDLAKLSAGIKKEEDPESYFMRREFKNGGTTSDTQIYVFSDDESNTGVIAEIEDKKFESVEEAKDYARSKGYPIEIVEMTYGQFKYGGGIDVNTYDFNQLVGKHVNIYSMGVAAPSISQIKSAHLSSPNFRYRNLTLKFDLGNAIIPFENINQFLNNKVVDIKADKEDYAIQLIANQFANGGNVRKMGLYDSVLYDGEQYSISEKNGVIGLKDLSRGAWGSDYPFIPLNKVNMSQVTDMFGNKVEISQMFAKGGSMYEDGGVIGQEIVFDDNGEENTGVIKDIHEITGDYIVATDDGRTVLAAKDLDVISLGKIREVKAKKRFSFFEDGGNIAKENNEMLHSQAKEAKHHIEELHNILTTKTKVEPWVVAKMTRAKTDLSDITHYLDGNTSKMAKGGGVDIVKKDRYGNEVKIGDAIHIRVLTGSYGQTKDYEGIVTNFDKFGNVELDGQKNLNYTADYTHNDYEHGHHIWVEKINPKDIKENLRVPKKYVPSYSGTINGEKFGISGKENFLKWVDKNYPNSIFDSWYNLRRKGWNYENDEYVSPEKEAYEEIRVYESAEKGQGFLYSLMIPKGTSKKLVKPKKDLLKEGDILWNDENRKIIVNGVNSDSYSMNTVTGRGLGWGYGQSFDKKLVEQKLKSKEWTKKPKYKSGDVRILPEKVKEEVTRTYLFDKSKKLEKFESQRQNGEKVEAVRYKEIYPIEYYDSLKNYIDTLGIFAKSGKMAKGGTLTSAQQNKFDKVMHEWKAGELHSGKNGPIVTNQDQAIAIAYSEARSKR